MVSRLPLLLFSLLTLLLPGCGSEEEAEPVVRYRDGEETADFDEFYKKFHSDSVYQMEHISWPLEGRLDTAAGTPTANWTPENWRMHRDFTNSGFERKRSHPIPGLVEEVIAEKTGAFAIHRRFAKIGDEWNLIYYRASVQE